MILLELAAEPAAQYDLCVALPLIAARTGCSTAEIEAAIAFWRGTGVLLASDGEESTAPSAVQAPTVQATVVPQVPHVIAEKGLPSYSTEELSYKLYSRLWHFIYPFRVLYRFSVRAVKWLLRRIRRLFKRSSNEKK